MMKRLKPKPEPNWTNYASSLLHRRLAKRRIFQVYQSRVSVATDAKTGSNFDPSTYVAEKSYERTLLELTKLTTERVGEYLHEDIAVLSAVAQQVNPNVKLDAVIA